MCLCSLFHKFGFGIICQLQLSSSSSIIVWSPQIMADTDTPPQTAGKSSTKVAAVVAGEAHTLALTGKLYSTNYSPLFTLKICVFEVLNWSILVNSNQVLIFFFSFLFPICWFLKKWPNNTLMVDTANNGWDFSVLVLAPDKPKAPLYWTQVVIQYLN